jgi:hypothetical protein
LTRASIRRYIEAVRGRYLWASNKERSRVVDEFTKMIDCHLFWRDTGETLVMTPELDSILLIFAIIIT